MGKKKCCGKYEKKGKHCGSCPEIKGTKKCRHDKSYCIDCNMEKTKKSPKKKKKTKK